LKSVYENVPVRRLIVIDAYSSDNTHGILAEFEQIYRNVDIISKKGSRGEARQRGIQEAQTDWFLFVDSDVVLCKN
jgi:glycosyltransferase involved in cell wall biosynthesis